jgi:hypothetical protein
VAHCETACFPLWDRSTTIHCVFTRRINKRDITT